MLIRIYIYVVMVTQMLQYWILASDMQHVVEGSKE